MVKMSLSTFDAAIIGGGPAGLAAAIAIRRKGLSVVVIDRAVPPIDKPCGEGLMPDGVDALSRLGIAVGTDEHVPFWGIRFIQEGTSTEGYFPEGHGLGIRRTTLHQILVKGALDAGASLLWGAHVTGISHDGVEIGDGTVRCRWIVAADGQNSRSRKWMDLDARTIERLRFGFVRHLAVAPWTDFVEVYWGDDCQVVITAVGPGEICATLATHNPKFRLEAALESLPALSDRIQGAKTIGRERGAVCGLRVLARVAWGRFAAVGDASGSVDSLTGEGVCLAFRQALWLADAIAANDLSLYASAHRKLARMPVLISRLMLAMDRHAGLRQLTLRALEAHPRLFSRIVAAHVAANRHGKVAPGLPGPGWQYLMD